MCTPATLTEATDQQLLQLVNEGLGELLRRYRPTQENRGLLARIDAARHTLEAVELEYAKLAINGAARALPPSFPQRPQLRFGITPGGTAALASAEADAP